jgi:hypothetical protein
MVKWYSQGLDLVSPLLKILCSIHSLLSYTTPILKSVRGVSHPVRWSAAHTQLSTSVMDPESLFMEWVIVTLFQQL